MSGAARSCGTCTLCCKVMGIAEIEKPPGQWCPHCPTHQSCAIYDDRPRECRTFNCGWLLDSRLPLEWRPDNAKFVLVLDEKQRRLVVYIDPARPQAWRQEPYQSILRRQSYEGLRTGELVVLSLEGQITLLLPDREIALGALAPDDVIELTMNRQPQGIDFQVKVRKPQTGDTAPGEWVKRN